jgi:hypothetical protein
MTTALEKRELPLDIVAPIDVNRLAEAFRTFQEFKQRLLTKDDSITIAGRQYLKKSAWRKWALACGVSDDIVSFERVPAQGKDPEGNFSYRVLVRAFHEKSGRSSAGVAVASRNEKKDWAHEEHDVFTLAHTRAKNRAIADLVGGGEVSAEEMTPGTSNQPEGPVPNARSPDQPWKVPVTKDQATPDLIKKGLRQFALGKDLQSVGMLNILNDEVSIVPEKPIPTDTALIDGFLLRRVVEPLVAKHHLAYTFQRNSGGLLEAVLIRGKMDDPLIKELVSGARWAFEKSFEEKKA